MQYDNQWYIVLVMCRIRPNKIRIPENCKGEFYIINNPADVRPYRLVLSKITQDEAQNYISLCPK